MAVVRCWCGAVPWCVKLSEHDVSVGAGCLVLCFSDLEVSRHRYPHTHLLGERCLRQLDYYSSFSFGAASSAAAGYLVGGAEEAAGPGGERRRRRMGGRRRALLFENSVGGRVFYAMLLKLYEIFYEI